LAEDLKKRVEVLGNIVLGGYMPDLGEQRCNTRSTSSSSSHNGQRKDLIIAVKDDYSLAIRSIYNTLSNQPTSSSSPSSSESTSSDANSTQFEKFIGDLYSHELTMAAATGWEGWRNGLQCSFCGRKKMWRLKREMESFDDQQQPFLPEEDEEEEEEEQDLRNTSSKGMSSKRKREGEKVVVDKANPSILLKPLEDHKLYCLWRRGMTSDQPLSSSSEEEEETVPGWIDYCMAIGSHYQKQQQHQGGQKPEVDEEEGKGDYEVSCQFIDFLSLF